MTEQQLLTSLAEALETDVAAIHADARIDSIPAWDSIGWLSVMAALDSEAGVHLTSGDIDGLSTVGELIALLRSRGALQ